VDSKGVHAVNGLQTSSFVVCSRIRPVLPSDLAADDGKSFPCVLAGPIRDVRTEQGLSHSEEAIVCTPKVRKPHPLYNIYDGKHRLRPHGSPQLHSVPRIASVAFNRELLAALATSPASLRNPAHGVYIVRQISLNGAPTIDEAASKFDFVFGAQP